MTTDSKPKNPPAPCASIATTINRPRVTDSKPRNAPPPKDPDAEVIDWLQSQPCMRGNSVGADIGTRHHIKRHGDLVQCLNCGFGPLPLATAQAQMACPTARNPGRPPNR